MKKFKRVLQLILAVAATFFTFLFAYWTYDDIMWMIEWDAWSWIDVGLEVLLVMFTGIGAWMFWWDGLFKHILDKDKQYILADLIKEFTDLTQKDPHGLRYLVMEIFTNLPPRDQIKILKKIVERRK